MNCFDWATLDQLSRPAIAVCHDCGAAVCADHLIARAHQLTHTGVMLRAEPVDPPARTIRSATCDTAWAALQNTPGG